MSTSNNQLLDSFKKIKIAVIGDVMIDTYVHGKKDRTSTEAPVPIFVQHHIEQRLGGAGNVALNLQSMGCTPYLFSVIGQDDNGERVLKLMEESNLETDYVLQTNRITTEKRRIIDKGDQIIRLDHEMLDPLTNGVGVKLSTKIKSILPEVDAVIFQDYDKGVLGPELIRSIIDLCQNASKPIVVDPKEKNFFNYKGSTLFKPNLRELEGAYQVDLKSKNKEQLLEEIKSYYHDLECSILLLTLSERGIIIFDGETCSTIPGLNINLVDVSGAGDTVVAVAALALVAGMSITEIGHIANAAGAQVCQQFGVVPVNRELLEKELTSNQS